MPDPAIERSGGFDRGGVARGAFEEGTLVGASILESRPIGPERDRLQLEFLHVGRSQRGYGRGRRSFERAATDARRLGARSLYISPAPSGNTVRFHLPRGCRLARTLDAELFELEPEDIHLEFEIPGAVSHPAGGS